MIIHLPKNVRYCTQLTIITFNTICLYSRGGRQQHWTVQVHIWDVKCQQVTPWILIQIAKYLDQKSWIQNLHNIILSYTMSALIVYQLAISGFLPNLQHHNFVHLNIYLFSSIYHSLKLKKLKQTSRLTCKCCIKYKYHRAGSGYCVRQRRE